MTPLYLRGQAPDVVCCRAAVNPRPERTSPSPPLSPQDMDLHRLMHRYPELGHNAHMIKVCAHGSVRVKGASRVRLGTHLHGAPGQCTGQCYPTDRAQRTHE